jgi:FolB domain-containing protein
MLSKDMATIKIEDLEVFYCVGVTDEERAKPQRLLLIVDMQADIAAAAMTDRLSKTIDYFEVSQELLKFGSGRSWKLIEKVAVSVAEFVKSQYHPDRVTVEVKKFVVPQAAYVSVTWTKE